MITLMLLRNTKTPQSLYLDPESFRGAYMRKVCVQSYLQVLMEGSNQRFQADHGP